MYTFNWDNSGCCNKKQVKKIVKQFYFFKAESRIQTDPEHGL